MQTNAQVEIGLDNRTIFWYNIHMTSNNNHDNRIELIGLNEFIQDDEDDIELGDADFERPFPDSDEAIRALQDIAESVYELEAECYRLRAELKTSNAERDEARLRMGRILTEIDCRIEHGAESNGHLEGIRNLFKNKK